jgi:hypothetical protein
MPPVATRYGETGGLCLEHLLLAVPSATDGALDLLYAVFQAHLAEAASPSDALASVDRDAPKRADVRDELEDSPPSRRSSSTLDALRQHYLSSSCPICRETGLAERRYLRWLCSQLRADADFARLEPQWLCAQHRADVRLMDALSADALADVEVGLWRGEVTRLRAPSEQGSRPTRAPWWSRHAPPETPRALRPHPCAVCRAAASVEARQQALIEAALGDPWFAAVDRVSHSVCVHHLLGMSSEAREGQIGGTAMTRLRVLAWELEENRTKRSWDHRFEPAGPETTAWLRALGQLDGRTFLGGTPRPTPAPDGGALGGG